MPWARSSSSCPPAPILRRELRDGLGIEISLDQAERGLAAEIAFYRAHMLEGRDAASVAGLHAQCAQALMAAIPPAQAADPDAVTEALLASLRFAAHADAAPALRAARGGANASWSSPTGTLRCPRRCP